MNALAIVALVLLGASLLVNAVLFYFAYKLVRRFWSKPIQAYARMLAFASVLRGSRFTIGVGGSVLYERDGQAWLVAGDELHAVPEEAYDATADALLDLEPEGPKTAPKEDVQ